MASQLKHFFDKTVVSGIGDDLAQVCRTFDKRRFVAECLDGLDKLELLARAWHIAGAMHRHLPADFEESAAIVLRSLRDETPHAEWKGMAVFRYLPHVFYVSKHGIDHLEPSLELQHALTRRFTAEYSIRPFLERYPDQTYARLQQWAKDPNVHVRRLVSEGTRPRLPWAPRLRAFQKDPTPVIALLEFLKDDPELYVRRSVANNLNDISKDHPDVAVEVCRRWMDGASADRKWIIRHALRVLVKKGHPGALEVMGVGARPKVRVGEAKFEPKAVKLGGAVRFAFDVASAASKSQILQVDYRVHFVKANGATAPKVFKLKRVEIGPRQSLTFASSVSFKPMTTRKSYAGVHRWEALINGVAFPLGEVRVK